MSAEVEPPRVKTKEEQPFPSSRPGARDVDRGAVVSERWTFSYSTAEERRAASKPIDAILGLKVLLVGKPCSGKGTQAPLMARKYRMVHISTGNLLRAEIQAETELGLIAREQMAKGELLPDELMSLIVKKRLAQNDCVRNGWILDGFPRTVNQARLMRRAGIEPDVVIELDRPDDLVQEWCLGRYHDAATGTIYHPKFNPPPPELIPRLIWRTDDTPETLRRRLQVYGEKTLPVLELFEGRVSRIDSARNELHVLEDISRVLEDAARSKGVEPLVRPVEDSEPDVPAALKPAAGATATRSSLLEVVLRCNQYNLKDFLPVLVGDELVGYASKKFASELVLLQQGHTVEVEQDRYVRLTPHAGTCEARTRLAEDLVKALVSTGVIEQRQIRNELQDVLPFLSPDFTGPPLLQLERGAMDKFGVPSHGVHVNGFVRTPEGIKLWIGKRSSSKASYPDLLDVLAAGGQPSGLSFRANAFKECEEEASIPRSLLEERLRAAGMISYRYQSKQGLSTKLLHIYDLELPESFVPYNGDGEVESFSLMPAADVLESIQTDLFEWKPNAALTVVDFAIRHGLIDGDAGNYIEMCHMLRGALAVRTGDETA